MIFLVMYYVSILIFHPSVYQGSFGGGMSQPQMMSQQEFPDDFGDFNSQADKVFDDMSGSYRGKGDTSNHTRNKPLGPGSSQSQSFQFSQVSFEIFYNLVQVTNAKIKLFH